MDYRSIAGNQGLSRRTEARYSALDWDKGEGIMNFKAVTTIIAAAAAVGLLAAPASAAPKKRVYVADARGATVYTSRDEDGRRRTRIIIQKRSYLDPGTEVFPGENSDHRYAHSPNAHATSVLDNTAFGANRTALPGAFTLPSRNTPFLQF
jgi:hypothetical protein